LTFINYLQKHVSQSLVLHSKTLSCRKLQILMQTLWNYVRTGFCFAPFFRTPFSLKELHTVSPAEFGPGNLLTLKNAGPTSAMESALNPESAKAITVRLPLRSDPNMVAWQHHHSPSCYTFSPSHNSQLH
jgi:hypothetical protein